MDMAMDPKYQTETTTTGFMPHGHGHTVYTLKTRQRLPQQLSCPMEVAIDPKNQTETTKSGFVPHGHGHRP